MPFRAYDPYRQRRFSMFSAPSLFFSPIKPALSQIRQIAIPPKTNTWLMKTWRWLPLLSVVAVLRLYSSVGHSLLFSLSRLYSTFWYYKSYSLDRWLPGQLQLVSSKSFVQIIWYFLQNHLFKFLEKPRQLEKNYLILGCYGPMPNQMNFWESIIPLGDIIPYKLHMCVYIICVLSKL